MDAWMRSSRAMLATAAGGGEKPGSLAGARSASKDQPATPGDYSTGPGGGGGRSWFTHRISSALFGVHCPTLRRPQSTTLGPMVLSQSPNQVAAPRPPMLAQHTYSHGRRRGLRSPARRTTAHPVVRHGSGTSAPSKEHGTGTSVSARSLLMSAAKSSDWHSLSNSQLAMAVDPNLDCVSSSRARDA